MSVANLIRKKTSIKKISQYLDKLSPTARVEEVTAINGKEQAILWELSKKGGALSLAFFTPPKARALKAYPFEGKNNLPLFNRFQKVFYKTKEGDIGGYNHQQLMWFTGPGYYILEESPENAPGPLVINYLKIPHSKPKSFPPIKSNDTLPTRFIYGGMTDYLRRVSKDVVIGRAYRHHKKAMQNYFLLCRPD